MKLRRKRIFRGAVLAFAVAAFAAQTAQAKPVAGWETSSAASTYAPQQLRALELRSQGMNERYGTAASMYAPQQLRALELRSQGLNARYGLAASTTTTVQSSNTPTLASASNGFNWGDAFAGAASTFATAIVLVAALTAVRRREHPLRV